MQHEHVGPNIVYLPMELHMNIRHKLITDLETTISQLRSLRLVCKLFDTVWSPIVLVNMTLFTGYYPTHHVNRLFDIVRGKDTTAAFTTTLTLRNWEFLELSWSFWILRNPWHYLRLDTLRRFKECLRARRYASLLPDKLQLPHLRCVRLFFPRSESNWATYQLTRMLAAFPQLTELELTTAANVDMAHVAQCLKPLRGLRKLKLAILCVRRLKDFPHAVPEINYFGRFIADNHNLTHLTFRSSFTHKFNLSELFLDVPSNRPLILEHFSCNDNCRNFEALLPHIQSISSFEFQCDRPAGNTWCTTLSDAGIFPPTMTAHFLDPQLTMYLTKHPAIVGLSLFGEGATISTIESDELCSILVQHSATLQYLKITSANLALMLRTLQNELNFKQCKNLREIALTRALWESDEPYHEKQVLPVLAHLDCSLTVVLQYVRVATFDACVEFCRKSDDTFVCNLAGRLVLEPLAT